MTVCAGLLIANMHFPACSHLADLTYPVPNLEALRGAASHVSCYFEEQVDARAEQLQDALQKVLDTRTDGAIIIYYAGYCVQGSGDNVYLTTADACSAEKEQVGLSVSSLRTLVTESYSSRVVLALDCVVAPQSAKEIEARLARVFDDVQAEVFVFVAPNMPGPGPATDSSPTLLVTCLARALKEGAFAPERAPEAGVDTVEALWRIRGTNLPLWRYPRGVRRALRTKTHHESNLEQSVRSDGAAGQDHERLVETPQIELGGTGTLWYGTNRRPNNLSDPSRGYSAERDDCVHYGRCKVYVPECHNIGSLGSSWWNRIRSRIDDRLKLVSIEGMEEVAYWADVRDVLFSLRVGARDILVFLHGYNVSFEEAALRTAQISCDLQFTGITAFFSWPSKGSLSPWAYGADVASIEASEDHIADFLIRCAAESGATRVHVIAHSMGNRGLLRAMNSVIERASYATGGRFGHFILAAPDVDSALFLRLAQAYHRVAQRTTLYVSDKDRALASSGIIHDYPRAGFAPPFTVLPNIDTVYVANVDLTWLGHGYVGEAYGVLNDMFGLLTHDAPPWRRGFLREKSVPPRSSYWEIRK